MDLFVEGDENTGFWIEIGNGYPVLTGSGEFSAVFCDPETGNQEEINGWLAEDVTQLGHTYKLSGVIRLVELNSSVSVQIIYEVINNNVIKKEIILNADRELLYTLSNRLIPKVEPKNYWTFEHSNYLGGPVYEIYPAMGMEIGNHSYGFLTDNGYRNRWTRISRQTDGHGFLVGLEKQPDAELMLMATENNRNHGEHFIQYKFGEFIDFTDFQYETINLSIEEGWGLLSKDAELVRSDEGLRVTGSTGDEKGVFLPITLDKNELYEICFEYQSKHPLSMRLLDAEDDSYFEWAKEFGAYLDQIASTGEGEWKQCKKSFFTSRFPNRHQNTILKIMKDMSCNESCEFELRNIEIRKYKGKAKPFHTLTKNQNNSIRLFIFEELLNKHRDLQVASQVRLAEGLGFKGTQAEKILYADNQMLVWINQHDKFVPHVVPSLNYHPDMYLRDTFWEVNAVFDQEVAEQCWLRYAETQREDGQLDTLYRAYRYAPSIDDNDSTMFFIMWGYINWKRYGIEPNKMPLKKALDNIRKLHSPNRDGLYKSKTAGWFDTIWGDLRVTAINQGQFAVVLQCAKELGLDVTDEEIFLAKQAYRALYNPTDGYLHWSVDEDYLSPSVLMGEFMNLWLFNKPILSDEAVVGTVEKLPVIKRGVPCIADRNSEMFTDKNKPWEEKYTWRPGVYHNGGSWFLYEYLAYVAAARHGWGLAKERMEWRLEMEFSKENEPYSHEFIPLTDDIEDWWPTCRMFGWNTFAIIANQVAEGASEITLKNQAGEE